MTSEGKFWLLCGFILILLAWVMVFASCGTKHKYVTPSGIVVELPHTPADTVKGGAR